MFALDGVMSLCLLISSIGMDLWESVSGSVVTVDSGSVIMGVDFRAEGPVLYPSLGHDNSTIGQGALHFCAILHPGV